ncbi:MAG: NAD(P)H-hydrate dehydratase [Alphaproteobacteria bacterium]|nr:NAD(P)H-hydrate dehydratase [Alphaproteobacteria bacterium]
MSEWNANGHEVLSVAQMMEADRLAIASGVPSLTLMENAGRAVADEICRRWSPRPTAVLCGPGNNGGDGYVFARHLRDRGWPVTVCTYGNHASLKGDAAIVAKKWTGDTRRMTKASVSTATLVVDALFGTGLKAPLKDDADDVRADICRRRSEDGVPIVVSVDVPSGVHGDIGPLSPASFIADLTVTFFRKKRAHLGPHTNSHEVAVADIGIPAKVLETIKPQLAENAPDCWQPAIWLARGEAFDGHKYNRGHVFVVSGHLTSTGAARLAARAAARAGSGLVTVLSPPDALTVNASHLTTIMLRRFDQAEDIRRIVDQKKGWRAVVVGPANGISETTRANVEAILGLDVGAVIDADALTSFEDDPAALFKALHNRCVLTPHAGEFARLFPGISLNQPIDAALAASARAGCALVLKGAMTVIADPSGRALLNTNAPGWLATAGSGDVLAGMIAALLAQGEPAFSAAAAAVWMHGDAARRLGRGLIAEDLPEVLPGVLRGLENRQSRGL